MRRLGLASLAILLLVTAACSESESVDASVLDPLPAGMSVTRTARKAPGGSAETADLTWVLVVADHATAHEGVERLDETLQRRGWELNDADPADTGGYVLVGLHEDQHGEFSMRAGPQRPVCNQNPYAPGAICQDLRDDAIVVTFSR